MAKGELISRYSTLVAFIVAGVMAEIFPLRLQIVASSAPSQIALPNCPTKCGDVSVPYPFGIGDNCHYNHPIDGRYYSLTCNYTFSPPRLMYGKEIEVVNITLDGEIRVRTYLAYACYSISGYQISGIKSHINMRRFTISTTSNFLVGIGCDTYVWFEGTGISSKAEFQSGCMTMCNTDQKEYLGELSDHCSGVGCCLANIPEGVNNLTIRARSFNSHMSVYDFNPCSIALVVAKNPKPFFLNHLLQQNETYLKTLDKNPTLPMVFDWSIGTNSCTSARAAGESEPICRGNSKCLDSPGWGYRCQCNPGFKGNPYLHDCQDIDECAEGTHKCENPAYCVNTNGSYHCSCPRGYGRRNATRDSDPCVRHVRNIAMKIILGVGGCIIISLIVAFWFHWHHGKRQLIEMREKYFHQNGGHILEQKLSGRDVSVGNMVMIFTVEEIKKATNNYSENSIIGRGGFGVVYKGILANNQVVAIKKSLKVDLNQVEQFINEVIALSHVNHKNVVKLLGCCLETEVPLLVYEYIRNGTLHDHLHEELKADRLTWDFRLRIAVEVSEVLSYLHTMITIPIIHRDIKSMNTFG